MKIQHFIYISLCFVLSLSCNRIEEIGVVEQVKVRMSLKAYVDSNDLLTKTYLDGEPVASVRNTYWLPEDTIAVMGANAVACFINTCTEMSAVAEFDGEIENGEHYYALYPYRFYSNPTSANGHSFSEGTLKVCLPQVQNYKPNTFATDVVPMVASFCPGEDLMFKNICGGLVFKLTGTGKITTAKFTAYDQMGAEADLSGEFIVDMGSEQYEMTPSQNSIPIVSLDCGDGVQLKQGEPTAFHFLLPPAAYHGFKASFVSSDGKYFEVKTDKVLNIKRSNITYVSPLTFEDNLQYIDLSISGTSNCYIVPSLGAYSFDATTIGNGTYGIMKRYGFHTEDPVISPKSVEVVWQDRENVVKHVALKDGRVSFISDGIEGNALIAVKDESGKIIWSWHIWVTDKPKEQTYVNSMGVFTVLDRNIGATRADRGSGSEWKESMGTLYFWGRKDPFYAPDGYRYGRRSMTLEESIQNPDVSHYTSNSGPWVEPENDFLWSDSMKTIYDPCPVGYRVAPSQIWTDFTTTNKTTFRIEEYNIDGSFDYGFNFYINPNKTETAWYPLTHRIDWTGKYSAVGTECLNWASDFRGGEIKHKLKYYYKSEWDTEIQIGELSGPTGYGSNAYAVRCIKDAGYVNLSCPQFESVVISDLTKSSARIDVTLKSSGAAKVVEKGIIWGTTSDLSDGVKVKCEDGADSYTCEIKGLKSSTKYYIKAYAINSYGEMHTDPKSFTTLYSGDEINLSLNGTANCYIASNSHKEYVFDCSVKGSSSELIEGVKSIAVLWETVGCSKIATEGSVIASASLHGSNAVIKLAEGVKEGNALVAVKDINETVLWSWHIWITDSPKEQTYQNSDGIFYVLDRNIGATRADRGTGDEWKDSRGLVYFWGRKDPFWYGSYEHGGSSLTVDYAIQHPTVRHSTNSWTSDRSSWLGDNQHDPNLWSADKKTKYDPCPAGYKVASNYIWSGFTLTGKTEESIAKFNVKGTYNNGWEFYINDSKTETAWYPAIYYMYWSSKHKESIDEGYVWSSQYSQKSGKYSLMFSEMMVQFNEINVSDGWGLPVRCMREE